MEVDDQAQAVPVLITSDVGTRAYVDWHLVNRPARLLPIRRRSSPPVPELPGKGNSARRGVADELLTIYRRDVVRRVPPAS